MLTYKLKAALDTLLSTHAPVILLDLDALILRAECFDEWLRIYFASQTISYCK